MRAFAEQMVPAHTALDETLRGDATKAGLPSPPMSLSGDQQKFLSALQSQTGPEFDRTYLRQQVLAHRQALVLEQAYAAQGADPQVRQAARSAVPVIQRHLAMATQLSDALGGR